MQESSALVAHYTRTCGAVCGLSAQHLQMCEDRPTDRLCVHLSAHHRTPLIIFCTQTQAHGHPRALYTNHHRRCVCVFVGASYAMLCYTHIPDPFESEPRRVRLVMCVRHHHHHPYAIASSVNAFPRSLPLSVCACSIAFL